MSTTNPVKPSPGVAVTSSGAATEAELAAAAKSSRIRRQVIRLERKISMKLIRRAKLLTLSALLPLAVLATGLATAAPAHAASSYILPFNPYPIYVTGKCSAPSYLAVYGWNFHNGESLTIQFYGNGEVLGSSITVTAFQDGPVVGFFDEIIPFPFPLHGQFTASVSEPDQHDYTWWAAAPPVTC